MAKEKKSQKKEPPKKNGVQIFLEEVTAGPPSHLSRWRQIGQVLLIPTLAILSGLMRTGPYGTCGLRREGPASGGLTDIRRRMPPAH